jgi:hypothetical protein
MSPGRRRWISAGLGIGLVVALLLIISLDDRYDVEPPDAALAIRDVQMYNPPPPPPPPPVAQTESSATGPQLSLLNVNNRISLDVMELDVDLPAGQFGEFGSGIAGVGEGTGTGLDVVDFRELDQTPLPVQAPALVYPDEAIERGLAEFEVFVHILVDEEGRAFPMGIVSNPIPSFSQEVLVYTSQVRFTPPTRLGIPVKTEYLWPLLIRRPPVE